MGAKRKHQDKYSRPVVTITAASRPRGCTCCWTPGHDYWGADVVARFTLTYLDEFCPKHKHVDPDDYTLAMDS